MNKDTIPKLFRSKISVISGLNAFYYKENESKNFQNQNFKSFWLEVKALSAAMLELNLKRGEKVGLIADSRREWVIIDLAVLSLGCADVPRGTDSPEDEVSYIISHSEATFLFIENIRQLEKLINKISQIKSVRNIVIIDEAEDYSDFIENIHIHSYKGLIAKGKKALRENPTLVDNEIDKGKSSDLATIIYTSGTTGLPKGVMLAHKSFLFQIERIYKLLPIVYGNIHISVLPLWHSFERACTYITMQRGAAIAYSKPLGSVLLKDLKTLNPQYITSVPRIWENIRFAILKKISTSFIKKLLFNVFYKTGLLYEGIKDVFLERVPTYKKKNFLFLFFKKLFLIIPFIVLLPFRILGKLIIFNKIKRALGSRFVYGISGGGALASYVDDFFKVIGIKLLEGYGLTETGPILSVRSFKKPVYSTVGNFLDDIEYKVVDSNGNSLPVGAMGELWVRSPQIMLGYYKEEEKTRQVITEDGWLKTGDLVVATINSQVSIVGRSKDTIVLSGGENIEPEPIESAIKELRFIENVVVIGQDQKFLASLIVPNFEELSDWANSNEVSFKSNEDLIKNPKVNKFYSSLISDKISSKNGFKSFERIASFKLLKDPFKVGRELTNTLKIKRHFVVDFYKDEIKSIFKTSE